MRRIAVLNTYTLPPVPGRETLRIRAFLAALADAGLDEGRDFQLDLIDTANDGEARTAARQLVASQPDLLHAVGTPIAALLAEQTAEIPIVYYGAHPLGMGEEITGAENVTGQVIHIPLTSSYKGFRFLKRLLPGMRVVRVAFFEETMWVHPAMGRAHRRSRAEAGRRIWMPGDDAAIGYPNHTALAYIIGAEYSEMVYADLEELETALLEIDPARDVLMLYNEPFYCPGAPELILSLCERRRIPLVWNNNAQIAALGGLCGISADFEALGRGAGEMAAQILAGAHPRDIPRRDHHGRVAWINLDAAEHLGLDLDPGLLATFDRQIRGRPGDPCM